ncbi:asparagine synthetase B [Anaeromyxobacter diazotrophicus]|uniref:asparagine synthase (glutamine-hydrolyzing) n=1 Tax=Anaeromyxobacter diazotrophicus TaxID=2590199 RepID=A0A7I9VGH0_9BACT|nr:asparagine synthetase B [Anaeromyxobacter diazotrophicus]
MLGSDVLHNPRRRLDPASTLGTGGVALGHRRLSILDLSAHGHQPMAYQDRFWMVFNGEVYNYLELRDELQAKGHRFTSDGDSEVVLAAYAEWGPACLSRFNGMWGLAILDLAKRTLFLARDRFGVKPLYYRVAGGRLAFASEIKAFSALKDWRPQANLPRLLDFLVWAVSDHTPETMFEGVHQIPAGHSLLLNVSGPLEGGAAVDGSAVRPERWYTVGQAAAIVSDTDAAEEVRATLSESVRLRLRSDVPVGSCLSGGLDSSSIVCIMSELLARAGAGERLRTFTAASKDSAFDESKYAQAIVARARSEAAFVTPEPGKLFDDLSRLTWHQDEPFGSTSMFAQWSVFEAARRSGVVVMLDGQGADEALCGYRGYFGAYLAGLVRKGSLRAWGTEAAAMRRVIGFSWPRSVGYTLAYLTPGLLKVVGRFDNRAYADTSWLHGDHTGAFRSDPIRSAGGRAHSVRGMSLAQITATHLPMLLRWEDRNSMAFSIEARVPFLDYRLVELSLRLADSEKLGGGVTKAVLRRAMRGIVPDVVLDRRDKMGFVTAEPLWMQRDLSARFRAEIAAGIEALSGVLSPVLLDRFDEVVAGRRPFDFRYWRALSVGRWAAAFSVKS